MRANRLLATLACLGLGVFAGCSRQSVETPTVGAVAVIDLDAIARRLGSDQHIVTSIAQRQSTLSQKLVELSKQYSQQIEERKKALAETPSKDTEVTLANWQQQANANLNKVKQQAELDLQRHRVQLIAQFREEIKPAVRRVAQSRGLSVIVTKNDSVLYDFSPSVDITEAVVAELLAARTSASQQTPAVAVKPDGTATPETATR